MDGLSRVELCRELGKDAFHVRNIQRQLGLYVPLPGQCYSYGYLNFMAKVVALRAFHVPLADVKALFETEKAVLRLLHLDSLTDSPTWYLDACADAAEDGFSEERLLLTGGRLGFSVHGRAVQHALDFGQRDPELFKGVEMGEDVGAVLRKYAGLLKDIRDRVEKERPVLEHALLWAGRALKRAG